MTTANLNIQPNVNNSSVVLAAQSSEMGRRNSITSVEIAEEVGKAHNDLLKSIRKMEPTWTKVNGGNFSLVEYIDSKGESRPCYQFNYEEFMFVASKFDDERRARLVMRWGKLETGQATPIHQMVQQPIQQPLVQPLKTTTLKEQVWWVEKMQKKFRLNDSSTLEMYQEISNQRGGILPIPKYIDSEGAILSASDLFKRMGYKNGKGLTAKLNIILKEKGILEQIERSTSHGETTRFWSITEEGLKYGENKICKENKKETNPCWYVAKFDEMLSVVGFNPDDYIKK